MARVSLPEPMVELDEAIARARQNLAASKSDLEWLRDRPKRSTPPPAGAVVVSPSLMGMSLTGLFVVGAFVAFSAGFLHLALMSTALVP